jgi:hypothetical protein
MLKFIRLLVEGLDELKAINYSLHHIRTEIRDELHTISGQLTEMQATIDVAAIPELQTINQQLTVMQEIIESGSTSS